MCASLYLPTEKGSRAPSFVSLNKDFILLKPNKSGQLLQGPRRVVRLCLFAVLIPAALITVPLYVRLMLYPPTHYPMMPTDQRLLARHASSFWCQAQSAHMNGTFTSYVTKGKPELRPERRTYTMLNYMQARDDVKEYWGFYLLKGSTVTISTCARWDGGQLLILRGVNNLRRCAWIGEKDSAEDMTEDDDEMSNERHRQEELDRARTPSIYQTPEETSNHEAKIGTEIITISAPLHSEERRDGITKLLRKALRLSKNKKEILKILHSEGKKQKSLPVKQDDKNLNGDIDPSAKLLLVDQADLEERNNQTNQESESTNNKETASTTERPLDATTRQTNTRKLKDDQWRKAQRRLNKRRRKKGNGRDKNLTEEDSLTIKRIKREVIGGGEEEDNDGAFEELDTEVVEMMKDEEKSKTPGEEMAVGTQVFFPEGLTFERGTFNQTTGNDNSREEQVSSFSSSEEALASCEGVIISLQLVPYRGCNYQNLEVNKISYDIPITGTYYFVFSSDNEIYINDLYFNLTMERVVYNVNKSEEMCTNSTDCIMPLSFWSDDQTVVEVPQEPTWNHTYVMDIKCEPRVYVYLSLLLLVPLLIMFCAFY